MVRSYKISGNSKIIYWRKKSSARAPHHLPPPYCSPPRRTAGTECALITKHRTGWLSSHITPFRIRVAAAECYKIAFRTRYGIFEYVVMPFKLANTPSTMYLMTCTRPDLAQ
ncbi:hypothetical protein CLOP_g23010 [Closterium sp. NIES-67]|nr:hypothetical protein CLOP_g23010 [Closterium sp. NIES-67]